MMVIQHSGMGGFLNPPGHPEHKFSMSDRNSSMSLSAVLDASWTTEQEKNAARHYLDSWVPLPIESDEMKNWIVSVLKYFKHCYSPDGDRNASNCIIDNKRDPVENMDLHLGVMFIRKYFPEWTPSAEDFDREVSQ